MIQDIGNKNRLSAFWVQHFQKLCLLLFTFIVKWSLSRIWFTKSEESLQTASDWPFRSKGIHLQLSTTPPLPLFLTTQEGCIILTSDHVKERTSMFSENTSRKKVITDWWQLFRRKRFCQNLSNNATKRLKDNVALRKSSYL